MSYYMTLTSQEKHLFLLCSYFHAHPTLLLKILGGRMHGPSPISTFGEPSPRVSVPACECLKHIEVRSVELVITEMTEGLIFYLNIHVHTFAAIWGAQWCSSQRSG